MPEKTYYAVFLKKFNNYFNRIIKGFQTLNEYLEAVGEGNYFIYDKPINYNPADNVSTELIMNDCPFDSDYVLILDGEGNIVAFCEKSELPRPDVPPRLLFSLVQRAGDVIEPP